MKLEGEYLFNGPRDDVWRLIRDPDVLATALPGTQSLTRLSDTEFEGAMNLHIGPVTGVFSGKVLVSDEVPPESLTLTAEGKGSQGFGKGVGRVQLQSQEGNKTLMTYEGDILVGGKLASVGQRNIETVSKSLVKQGLAALDKALEARVAASAGEAVAYTPPSETEFAIAVAKDVAGDLKERALASPYGRILIYAVPLIFVLIILVFILSRCAA
ncbi:carbon monoxide dehydrogenase subunit G [Candidatus Amarolinea dominans]|uniref:CoxG family protein n=1 Tax=Candidatus Amarolinea dominans TaxID=3140696 RepID=UPI003136CEC2|nr:carbon monoxide dehydrogenase subunit G [Anaerolineae bacterium]